MLLIRRHDVIFGTKRGYVTCYGLCSRFGLAQNSDFWDETLQTCHYWKLHVTAVPRSPIPIFQIRNDVPSNERAGSAVSLSNLFTIESPDVKLEHIVDMAFSSPPSGFPTMWMVADSGSVYRCRSDGGRKVVLALLLLLNTFIRSKN